jgi:outer membrane protein
MKTFLISLIFSLMMVFGANAQTEKGRWTVGAQVGNFTYQTEELDYRNISGSLTPSAGYFVTNGLVIGTGVPFSFSSTKLGQLFGNYDNLRQNGTSIGLSPFVRYYVGPAKLKPFVGIAYSYSRTISKYKTDTAGGSESKSKGHSTALTPTLGVAYFINHNLALTASLNYNINHLEYRTVETSPYTPGPSIADIDTKSLSLGLGFQLFIGK